MDIFYWDNKHEVDFVVKNKDNSLIAINVTYISNISELNEREINGLLNLKNNSKTKELIILTQDFEFEDKQIKYIPLWKWLLK